MVIVAYLVGILVSLVAGIVICFIIREGLHGFLFDIFGKENLVKFWSLIIKMSIIIASLAGGMSQTYDLEEAKGDWIILTWNFMNQLERFCTTMLVTFLVIFVFFLIAYIILVKRQQKVDKGD